jgi:hypothetical protein
MTRQDYVPARLLAGKWLRAGLCALLGATLIAADDNTTMAGAPKVQRVAGYTAGGQVRARVITPEQPLVVALAQVHVPGALRTGRSCRSTSGAAMVGALSRELHLDLSVRLGPQGLATYLMQSQLTGAYDTPARSFNLLLVQRGIATVDGTHGIYRGRFLATQRSARRARRGLWACRPARALARQSGHPTAHQAGRAEFGEVIQALSDVVMMVRAVRP